MLALTFAFRHQAYIAELTAALEALPRWGVVKHGDSAIVEQLQSQQDREDNYFIYAVAASIMAQSKHHWRLHRCQGRAPCTNTETPGVV